MSVSPASMSASVSSVGAFSEIRRATAHVDSDGLSSKAVAKKLQKLEVPAVDSADPSASFRASNTPSAGTDAESINSVSEDDDRLQRMAAACKTILECLGEDPTREGLLKTPMRMAKALVACTAGYSQEPSAIVSDALFACDSDDMVVVRDIACYSMCEHHMLPFLGRVHIAYMPTGKVVGLSKLARLTDCFSKRLQIQERLTRQIAQAVEEATGASGVAVMCEATHMCMTMRGVEKPGSVTQSVCYLGAFKEGGQARDLRQEFNAAVRGGGASPVGR